MENFICWNWNLTCLQLRLFAKQTNNCVHFVNCAMHIHVIVIIILFCCLFWCMGSGEWEQQQSMLKARSKRNRHTVKTHKCKMPCIPHHKLFFFFFLHKYLQLCCFLGYKKMIWSWGVSGWTCCGVLQKLNTCTSLELQYTQLTDFLVHLILPSIQIIHPHSPLPLPLPTTTPFPTPTTHPNTSPVQSKTH
jgi:hypothetical protein